MRYIKNIQTSKMLTKLLLKPERTISRSSCFNEAQLMSNNADETANIATRRF